MLDESQILVLLCRLRIPSTSDLLGAKVALLLSAQSYVMKFVSYYFRIGNVAIEGKSAQAGICRCGKELWR